MIAGSDDIFGEFLTDSYRILTTSRVGNRSVLNFEDHPERKFSIDWYDWNADALRVWHRRQAECMAT